MLYAAHAFAAARFAAEMRAADFRMMIRWPFTAGNGQSPAMPPLASILMTIVAMYDGRWLRYHSSQYRRRLIFVATNKPTPT